MNAPVKECEPPQFMAPSNDEATGSSATPPAAENASKEREQQIQVETNAELDVQQVNFAAFADDSDQ